MRCILFRSGGSQIDVAFPARDSGNPPDWLEVDGIHYKCQGRVEAVTGWIFQEKEKAKDGVAMAFGNEPVQSGSYAFKGLKYHVNDGVGEDLPASTSSVKYLRAKIADLEADINANAAGYERKIKLLDDALARAYLKRDEARRDVDALRLEVDEVLKDRDEWKSLFTQHLKVESDLRNRLAAVVELEVHEEEVARLKGIIDSTFKKLHSVEEEYERLRGVRKYLEAEIRLLREGSNLAKDLEIQRLKEVIIKNVKDLNASEAFSLKALAAQDREIALLKSDLKVGADLRRQLQAEIDVLLSERK